MSELKDIIAYIIDQYPTRIADELSNARLTKIIYLSDWKNCLKYERQLTNIDWYFDNHGPYVHDVIDTVEKNNGIFVVSEVENIYGRKKRLIGRGKTAFKPILSKQDKASIDVIISVTKKMYWSDFINLVYGTYPITSSDRYTKLNLVKKSKEYLKGD